MNETDLQLDAQAKTLVSNELAWTYRIIPAEINEFGYTFYIDEQSMSAATSQELQVLLGKKITLIPKSQATVERSLTTHFVKKIAQGAVASGALDVTSKDFVYDLFAEARHLKSSDIHLEVYEQLCRIRFRMDGKLIERVQLQKTEYPSLINKLKIMAGLDISEKRLPQDGRIFFNRNELKFDVRVSVLPTLYGEKIVLRILANTAADVRLDTLGFSPTDLDRYRQAIQKPNGIILISGPTGSGKTTTLYGTLHLLNDTADNILTVEDPIEYTLPGINQVQVKEDIGLTFTSALRTFLRQDPDIIMVGEIRDSETATLAIRAALTGHLVLSTIHTNSAWGTVSRLIDMGIPPFLLASTLSISVAQRLVRTLCPLCKIQAPMSEAIFPSGFKASVSIENHFIAKGCQQCYYTGYRGRKAIYEVIPIDDVVRDFIVKNEKSPDQYFKSQKIQTLQASAFQLVSEGLTSIEEIYPMLLDDQF
jgi:type IV pilus assembly protein PilB